MSNTARSGTSHTFEYVDPNTKEKKIYQCSLLTDEFNSKCEQEVYARERKALTEMKDAYPVIEVERDVIDVNGKPTKVKETVDQYKQELRKLRDDYAVGRFSLESPVGQNWLNSVDGFAYTFSLLFDCSTKEVKKIMINDYARLVEFLETLAEESNGVPKKRKEGDEGKPVDFRETAKTEELRVCSVDGALPLDATANS